MEVSFLLIRALFLISTHSLTFFSAVLSPNYLLIPFFFQTCFPSTCFLIKKKLLCLGSYVYDLYIFV